MARRLSRALKVRLPEAAQAEHQHLQQIPRQQKWKIQHKHQKGHVLPRQKDAVAPALHAFELIIAHGAGGGPADMVAPCRRAVHVLIPKAICSPGDIHIFKIGKKRLIKQAYLVQDAPAVQAGAAAGRKKCAAALYTASSTCRRRACTPSRTT